MAVKPSHEPVTENHETVSQQLRPEPVATSRPLIYTKEGHVIEEWLDGEIKVTRPRHNQS